MSDTNEPINNVDPDEAREPIQTAENPHHHYYDSQGELRWKDTNQRVQDVPIRPQYRDEDGIWRWSDTGEAIDAEERFEPNAATRLPDLTGKSREEAEDALLQAGFIDRGKTAGGYHKFYHPDGSRIQVRPNGEVVRTGPKIQNPDPNEAGERPRIGPDGRPTSSHNSGEMLRS